MPERGPRHWFHAKRGGWRWGIGWARPARREGWVVAAAWAAVVVAVTPLLAPYSVPLFVAFILVMAAVPFAICYAKGEPTRWRRGG